MAFPWECLSRELLSENKSVFENAVTGVLWSSYSSAPVRSYFVKKKREYVDKWTRK